VTIFSNNAGVFITKEYLHMKNINEAKAVPTRFTDELGEAIKAHISKDTTAEKKQGEVARLCYENNIPVTDLMSPSTEGSTSTDESWAWLRNHVESGFPADVQKALNLPLRARSEKQKELNRKYKTKYTSYISRYRKSLEGLYNPKEPKPKTVRAPQQPVPKTGDKVVDEANAISMKAIKKETDLQNWCVNNLPENKAKEISQLRAQIIALLQPEPTH